VTITYSIVQQFPTNPINVDNVASINGTTVSINNVGHFYIRAITNATNAFNAAVPVSRRVTVTPANTITGQSSTTPVEAYSPITPITHTTTGATGIGTVTGLPAGLTASFASNTVTISGTATELGPFNYSIPLTGGCSVVTGSGSITVNYSV
jgi:hypothetical protein